MQHVNRYIIAVLAADRRSRDLLRNGVEAGVELAEEIAATFIRLGVQRSLEGPRGGAAPIEGAER